MAAVAAAHFCDPKASTILTTNLLPQASVSSQAHCNGGVQSIARQGQWLKAVMYKAYLRLFSMPGLLSMGDYPEGSKSNNTYWAPRFQVWRWSACV